MTRLMFCLAIAVAVGAGCAKEPPPKAKAPAPPTAATNGRVEISVTDKGFQPKNVSVPKGEPVTLVFTRRTEKTCATEIILEVEGQEKIERKLPLNEAVEVTATFPKAGELRYACAMDMISGVITVQ